MTDEVVAEVFPLIWSHDVAAISDWAVSALGFVESWRANGESGVVEHAEIHGFNGKVSINIDRGEKMGPSGISLRVDDVERVNSVHQSAISAGANITQGPEESPVAFSFTATDPDGNQWWVNAETGFLDRLREDSASS
ncbi:MAG: putative glyoxalase superfamily protein PhnB [Patiriisocius sp.]|jgi:uncharacterized glyoxalase superfamily protein PhnB